MAQPEWRYTSDSSMPGKSRPATPEQVRLMIGLSSLLGLPMVAFVMLYVTSQQAGSEHAPAWRAFAIGLGIGACLSAALLRFFPLFGGSAPSRPEVRTALVYVGPVALIVVILIGRLLHQAVPLTIGSIGGADAALAIVLLTRSLRSLSQMATPPRS